MLLYFFAFNIAAEALGGSEKADVIVVGGGLAGLTAAYRLKNAKPDLKVKLLEARDAYGGRAYSPEFKVPGGTDRFNLGGEWIGLEQQALVDILKELDIGTHSTYATGDVLLKEGKYFQRNPTTYGFENERDRAALLKRTRELDEFIWSTDLGKLDQRTLAKYEKMSLDDWMKQKGFPRWIRQEINYYTEEDVDGSVDSLSLAFFIHYTQSKESFKTFSEDIEKIFEAYRINDGSQKLADGLLEKVGSENLEFNCAVTQIIQNTSGCAVACADGRTYTSSYVILAVPPVVAKDIKFIPELPAEKAQLLRQFKPFKWQNETTVKAVLTFGTPFWREMGLSGTLYAEGGKDTMTTNLLPSIYAVDATSVKENAALVVFADVEGNNLANVKHGILTQLEGAFGSQIREHLDYKQHIWTKESHIKGCVATLQPGQFSYRSFVRLVREPFDKIYFAGTETAEKSFGYLSGAVDSGNRVSREVLLIVNTKGT